MPLILGLIEFLAGLVYPQKKVMKNGKEEEVLLPIGIQQFWIVFYILHDRSCHRHLPESDTDAAT